MHYRYLRKCLLGWYESRLGFVTPCEYLWAHSVIHHIATNSLVTLLARLIVMCITERAQRYLSVYTE